MTLSRSCSEVEVSSRSQENIATVAGATLSKGFLVSFISPI